MRRRGHLESVLTFRPALTAEVYDRAGEPEDDLQPGS